LQCLVVDDSKSARFTLKKALISLGHDVITADDGEHALEILCGETPDVIFMDHLMPGLDGFETSKKIRSQSNFAKTPIIMCTAKDSESYALEAKRIGLSGTLPKPASEEQLRTLFSTIEQNNKAAQSSTEQQPTPVGRANQAPEPVSQSTVKPLVNTPMSPTKSPSTGGGIELNDQIRSLIRAEAEGRARDSAQRLLSDSWGRFRGNLQEDVRQHTRDMFDQYVENSMDKIINNVRSDINASLSSELRHYVDKKLNISETQANLNQSELNVKINGLKRQLDMQKFDPVALQDTILEDARRAAEYTATHKAVDTARKIARELCEETVAELLDTSILESFEQQLSEIHTELEIQTSKAKTLTMVASFASVLATLSFAVAVWALI